MIAPDTAVERDAFVGRRAGAADVARGENAVAAVEPAVGSPFETVDHVVLGLSSPAVEDDLRLAVGHVVAVFVGNEEQVRGAGDPDAAVAVLYPGQRVALVPEDRALVVAAVAVGVFKDHHAVAVFHFEVGIRITLAHPHAAAIVEGHGDRLADVGLAGKESDVEAVGDGDSLEGFGRRERRAFGVGRQGKVVGRTRVAGRDKENKSDREK
jgi:hypothetical protein